VRSKCFCFGLAKNVGVLVVFLQDRKEVDFFRDSGRIGLHCGMELEEKVIKPVRREARSRAGALIIAI